MQGCGVFLIIGRIAGGTVSVLWIMPMPSASPGRTQGRMPARIDPLHLNRVPDSSDSAPTPAERAQPIGACRATRPACAHGRSDCGEPRRAFRIQCDGRWHRLAGVVEPWLRQAIVDSDEQANTPKTRNHRHRGRLIVMPQLESPRNSQDAQCAAVAAPGALPTSEAS
jgi:hypothetical protein